MAISGDLSKSKPFSVIVRRDSKNHNEIKYVIGTNAGLDRYRKLHSLTSDVDGFSDEEGNGKDEDLNRDATYSECIHVLQGLNGGEKLENILKLVSQRNPSTDRYLDHRFKVEDSRKVQGILKLLLDHPRVKTVHKHPWTLRWVRDKEYVDPFQSKVSVHTAPQQIPDSSKQGRPQDHESAESLLTGVSQNEDHFSENNIITFETEKTKIIQADPQNKKHLSAMNRVLPDSNAPDSSFQQSTIIRHRTEIELNQQRAKIRDLVVNGHTQREVASILGISQSSVTRALYYLRKHNQEKNKMIDQRVESQPRLGPYQHQRVLIQQKVEDPVGEPAPFEDYIRNFASFDCEWYRSDVKENNDNGRADQIYCFCLIDVSGKKEQLHINQFNGDRNAFMNAILDVIERYSLLIGYWIFGDNRILSDLDHIKINCIGNGLQERFERIKGSIKFLDIHKIFSNLAIQGSLSGVGVTYREENLNAVAVAYLGDGERKTEGISGTNVENQTPDRQLEYCIQDAQLCMKLAQKNDYELLRILHSIGKEIGLDLAEAANANGPITWWTSKLESIKYEKADRVYCQMDE